MISKMKNVEQSRSLVEFYYISAAETLPLKPKQGLLAEKNKLLGQLLLKGLKGSFDPILKWLQFIEINSSQLLNLAKNDDESLEIVFETLRPGLLSRSDEAAFWTYRVMLKLIEEMMDLDLHPLIWKWFCKESGGLGSCILGLKKHENVYDYVGAILSILATNNAFELLTVELKKTVAEPQNFINLTHEFLDVFLYNRNLAAQIQNQGVLNFWLDFSQKSAEFDLKSNLNLRISSLLFLTDLFIKFPDFFFDPRTRPIGMNILNLLKRASREKGLLLRITAITFLFKLLENSARIRNHNAPFIYKILTFSLIENFEETQIREFLLGNFSRILGEFPEIPINILLDPLVRQIQVKEDKVFDLNVFDIDFLAKCCSHPKMNEKLAIIILDCLVKVFLQNFILAQPILKIIESLIWRYLESDIFQEFLSKVLIVVSDLFARNEKNKKNLPLFNKSSMSATEPFSEEEEREIVQSQKNALIVELMRIILEMKSLEINENFMPVLIDLYLKTLRSTKKEHKGLIKLISIMGDPKEIIKSFKRNNSSITKKNKSVGVSSSHRQLTFEEISERGSESPKSPKSHKNSPKIRKNLKKSVSIELREEEERSLANIHSEKLKKEESKPKIVHKKPKVVSNEKPIENYQRIIEDDETLNEEELEIMRKYGLSLKKKPKDSSLKIAKKPILNVKSLSRVPKDNKERSLIEKRPKKPNANSMILSRKEKTFEEYSISLVDFELEKRDKESLDIVRKKHEGFFRQLFNKYANSTNQAGVSLNFRPENDISFQNVSLADIRKFVRDFGLNEFVQKQFFEQIFSDLNVSLLGENRKKPLNFENFLNFIISLARFILEKPPFDFVEAPLGILLEEMVDLLWKLAVQKGDKQLLLLFSKNNRQNIRVQVLNKILRENPESEIPDGFKKSMEKDIDLQYCLPSILRPQVKSGFQDCYEIVDEILFKSLGFHIVEPLIFYREIVKAKPVFKTFQRNEPRFLNKSVDFIEKVNEKPRFLSEESQERAEKRKKRGEYLSKRLEKMRREKEGAHQRQGFEDQKIKEEMKDKNSELLKRRREKSLQNKEKVKEFQLMKQSEKERKLQEQKHLEEKRKTTMNYKLTDFQRHEIEKLEKQFTDVAIKRKLEIERLETEKNEDLMKKELKKKKIEAKYQEQKRKREMSEAVNKKIADLMGNADIIRTFQGVNNQLKFIFDFLRTNIPIDKELSFDPSQLQFKGYLHFLLYFDLIDPVLSISEGELVYRSASKDIKLKERIPIGVNFEIFQNALIRLSLKKPKFFKDFPSKQIKNQAILPAKPLNFYEITVDRNALDDYPELEENTREIEKTVGVLSGFFSFLGLKAENEMNLDELKRFLKEKWRLFKEKKKEYKRKDDENSKEKENKQVKTTKNEENKEKSKEKPRKLEVSKAKTVKAELNPPKIEKKPGKTEKSPEKSEPNPPKLEKKPGKTEKLPEKSPKIEKKPEKLPEKSAKNSENIPKTAKFPEKSSKSPEKLDVSPKNKNSKGPEKLDVSPNNKTNKNLGNLPKIENNEKVESKISAKTEKGSPQKPLTNSDPKSPILKPKPLETHESVPEQIVEKLGSLNVLVEKADLSRDILTFGKMSPVYKLTLWSQEILSQPCKKGGKKPSWTQTLSFKQKKGVNLMKIEVYEENKYTEKDLIGRNSLSLDTYTDFEKGSKFSDWVDIYYENKKSGSVFVNFEFVL